MPITAIPFQSPPAFDLPAHIAEALDEAPLAEASQLTLDLLRQTGCGDAFFIGWVSPEGQLVAGPHLANDPRREAEVDAAAADLGGLALDSDAGRADFWGQALVAGRPLLMMGELKADEASPYPASLRDFLLAGAPAASVGFFYVFPLIDTAGRAHGALAIHRSLGSGPLNHDQPAIAHALVQRLAAKAGA